MTKDKPRWAARCAELTPGHWHCRHGHLTDCPQPASCPRVDPEETTFIVQAGPMVWLFRNPVLGEALVAVLLHGGANVKFQTHATPAQVEKLLDGLPKGWRTVEDCR